jgi:hypothetical protein
MRTNLGAEESGEITGRFEEVEVGGSNEAARFKDGGMLWWWHAKSVVEDRR